MPKAALFAQGPIPINWIDLSVGLILSFVIGLGAALIYRITHRNLNYERSFLTTLVMVGPIVAVVMMFIGSNLALSLGMVGALSIIRFRTVIKDSRDMVFLFWMIASGLGCGTYNWEAVLISCVFIGLILLLLFTLDYGRPRHSDYVLVISGRDQGAIEAAREKIRPLAPAAQMRSLDIKDDAWELVLELRVKKGAELEEGKLLAEIKALDQVEKVSLLAPQLALPV